MKIIASGCLAFHFNMLSTGLGTKYISTVLHAKLNQALACMEVTANQIRKEDK